MLTAKGDESDRVVGLELGADDYLPKPFGLKELLARIRAVLRRYRQGADRNEGGTRVLGPLELDPLRRTLCRDGRPIELTRSEFDILDLLTASPGRVFTRDDLLRQVRGGDTEAFDRAVDTHISNLRRKIEADPKQPRLILTVWGVGYKWAAA
jgi:two-component system phosphate regulon response regulator OmpR